ncbi:DUF4386 family protein [Deinococcus pimensis]|uniref:DUF4386 family protein n=1 Tax=Deinococcus pimensis TaxID=309888 RepID=UPI0004834451|nr:DUF4386 family protein [Deinococcus pimensis]
MTSTPVTPTAATARPTDRTALLAVTATQFVSMFGAFFVLSAAIDWPASLDLPPERALPLVHAQASGVALGYTLYFLSAFLLVPLAVLARRVLETIGARGALLEAATALGVLAGALKLLGIVRWLVAMPALASAYASGDAGTREIVAVTYRTLNDYAGGVGEVLGVSLFSGLWTVLVGLLLTRLPRGRALGVTGVVSGALLLAGLAGVYGADLGPILTVSGIAWQIWLVALAVTLLRAPNRA